MADATRTDQAARYFVSMQEDEGRRRRALLDGPFDTEAEAEAAKPAAIRWACEHDPRAEWYLYGLCRTTVEVPTPLMRREVAA